jgi:cytochrome b6-f complex iron-sulfur subunit
MHTTLSKPATLQLPPTPEAPPTIRRIPAVSSPVPRRRFIRYALFSLLGAFTATSAAATFRLLYPTKVAGFGARVAAGTVEEVKAQLASQKYVRNATGHFFLLPATEDGVIAVHWKCVHLGCTVPAPNPDLAGNIQCPCHGSLYNGRTGDLIHGPATRPLDYFPVTIENGNAIVDTGTVITRQAFTPDQATRLNS